MEPCAISTDALVRDVLASVDCLIAGQVESGYAALLAPGGGFSNALTIGLTIYVAIIGYRLILGHAGLTLGELVPHFIKIGLILALVTSWPSYQVLVFDLLFRGPEQLADAVVRSAAGPGAAAGDILTALQDLFDRLTGAAGAAWTQTPPPVPVVPSAVAPLPLPGTPVVPAVPASSTPLLPFALGAPQFVALLLWASALLLLAASVGVLLVVRIVLALLLVLGPLFIALALFAPTRGLFEGWLRTTVKFALVPLFTLPFTAAVIALLVPFAAELPEGPIQSVRDTPALAILLIAAVFAAVMWQAARLGGGIAGGIRLRRLLPQPAAVIVPPAATVAREAPALVPISRAGALAQTIDLSARRAIVTGTTATPGAVPATRLIGGPATAAASTSVADASGRLGQGYRRLAVAPRGGR